MRSVVSGASAAPTTLDSSRSGVDGRQIIKDIPGFVDSILAQLAECDLRKGEHIVSRLT